MGTKRFLPEGLVLKIFFKKVSQFLCSIRIYLPCLLLLIALTSACVDYIDFEKESTPIPKDIDLEIKVFEEINNYRESINLNTLINSEVIAKVARLHSNNMANGKCEFGHTDFDKRYDDICYEIKNVKGMSENVAYGNLTAESVSKIWVNSSGHKKNIEGDYTHTGVGIAEAKDGSIYFTQIFIKIE